MSAAGCHCFDLDFIYISLLAHEWDIIVLAVKVLRIRHINLPEVALTNLLSHLGNAALKLIWVVHPFESTSWKWLAHHSAIQVIRIQVLKVMTLFPRIKSIAHVLVVCLSISMNCLSNAASCVSLKCQQHFRVS